LLKQKEDALRPLFFAAKRRPTQCGYDPFVVASAGPLGLNFGFAEVSLRRNEWGSSLVTSQS